MVLFATLSQTKYEITARDFSFEGIKFGTSLLKFEKKFPNSKIYRRNENGTFSYFVEFPSNSPSSAMFSFYQNKLFHILFSYRGLNTETKGQNFAKAMLKKFGYNPIRLGETEFEAYVWDFPNVNRRIAISPNRYDDEIILILEDTKVSNKFSPGSEINIDLGF